MKYKLTEVTWEVWLSLGRCMGLYLWLALVDLDGSIGKLILCMNITMIYMMIICWCYNINDIIWWWWLSSWSCNWVVLLMYDVRCHWRLCYVKLDIGYGFLLRILDLVSFVAFLGHCTSWLDEDSWVVVLLIMIWLTLIHTFDVIPWL